MVSCSQTQRLLLAGSLLVLAACANTPPAPRPCEAFKGISFGDTRDVVNRHIAESDAFECWDDSCGGGYSLLGPYSRIVVPDYKDDKVATVWLFTDHIHACCLSTLVRGEWELTLEELTKRYGEPEQVAEFPEATSEWFPTHRWKLQSMSVELALYPTEDENDEPSYSVVAGLTDNACAR